MLDTTPQPTRTPWFKLKYWRLLLIFILLKDAASIGASHECSVFAAITVNRNVTAITGRIAMWVPCITINIIFTTNYHSHWHYHNYYLSETKLFSNIQQKCLLLTDDSNSYHLSLLRWKPCVQAHRLLCDWDVWRRLPPCPQHKVIPREHVKGLSLCFKLTSILYSVFMSFSTWH